MHRGPNEPVNLGNDEELTVLEIAERIRELTGSRSELVFLPRPQDDPERRRPDLSRARELLGWSPRWASGVALSVVIGGGAGARRL
jgi:UDP-glucuronate decarboxylase